MQSAGMVALALLAGVVLVVVFAGMVILGFFMWKAKAVFEANTAKLAGILEVHREKLGTTCDYFEGTAYTWKDETTEMLNESATANAEFIKAINVVLENHKNAATSARAEQRAANEAFLKEARAILTTHHDEMKAITNSINGEALMTASARAISACIRIEKITSILSKLLQLHNEREESPSGLGAEEYAPDNAGTIYDQTPTAKQDLIDFREEVEGLEGALSD